MRPPLVLLRRNARWKTSQRALLLTLLAGALLQPLAAQNLLVNGDFEQNDRSTYANYYPAEDLAYIPQPDVVPGWTFGHSVDLYGLARDPQAGTQFLDLVGGGPLSAEFSIQQTFATTPGQSYALSFFYGNNEDLASALATFTASLIGSGVIWTQNFSHTGDTYSAHNWTAFNTIFIANSSSTVLRFLDTSNYPTGYDPTYTVGGSTLDTVMVISAVPEPGGMVAALLTAGFCCAPVLTRLRRANPRRRRGCID